MTRTIDRLWCTPSQNSRIFQRSGFILRDWNRTYIPLEKLVITQHALLYLGISIWQGTNGCLLVLSIELTEAAENFMSIRGCDHVAES